MILVVVHTGDSGLNLGIMVKSSEKLVPGCIAKVNQTGFLN